MIKATINGTDYPVAEGAVFVENYNETLDSGTILIQQVTEPIEIQPYDTVVVSGDGFRTRRFLVDAVTRSEISLQPRIYKYEISLFSETKALEGILLPNLKITRIPDRPLKVLDYIRQYVSIYCPKTDSNDTYGAYGDAWTLDDGVGGTLRRFDDIECPEMQWNAPTLREVLNSLMMTDDCIAILDNGVIKCLDVSETKGQAPTAGINYVTESHSSEDYVSELKMHLVNAANNSHMDPYVPDDASRIIEKIGFRNDESYILTTENMRLQTAFPIWKIFRCVAHIKAVVNVWGNKDGEAEQSWTTTLDGEMDITDYILEHGEWLKKDVYYGDWQLLPPPLSTDYRNTCLYYTRGAKNIENFNEKTTSQWLFVQNSKYVWELIIQSREMEANLVSAAADWLAINHPDYTFDRARVTVGSGSQTLKSAQFELEYEAMDDCVFTASKSPLQKHRRTVADNQANSYINVDRTGLLEYMKANRLGNKMAHINGRYEGFESTMPTLGQTIEGKIIFRKEISVYMDHIDANFLATENYVLRDYFTGVRAKLRSWRVISGQEALVRAEHIKFYVNDELASPDGEYMFPTANPEILMNWFKYCVIRFNTSDGWMPGNTVYGNTTYRTNAIAVEFTKHKAGNSVVFTIRMPDNYFAGNYISNFEGENGRIEQKGIGYTDDNGRIIGGVVYFFDTVNPHWFGNADSDAARALKPLCKTATDKDDPSGDTFKAADMMARIPFRVNKDNGEILQLSIQFEANGDANDVFLGHKDI